MSPPPKPNNDPNPPTPGSRTVKRKAFSTLTASYGSKAAPNGPTANGSKAGPTSEGSKAQQKGSNTATLNGSKSRSLARPEIITALSSNPRGTV